MSNHNLGLSFYLFDKKEKLNDTSLINGISVSTILNGNYNDFLIGIYRNPFVVINLNAKVYTIPTNLFVLIKENHEPTFQFPTSE